MRAGDDARDALPVEFPGGRLRRMRPDDLGAFQGYRNMPELGRFQGWSPMSDADAHRFLVEASRAALFAPGEWIQLAIADPQSDALIGDVGLYLSEDGLGAEMGITLQPAFQGRGIATRAVDASIRLLYAVTGAREVLGIADSRNGPSVRMLERAGFEYRESRAVVFRGEPCIELIYLHPRGDV
jgi:aminoglycoside 6'-N-acetyltransferase